MATPERFLFPHFTESMARWIVFRSFLRHVSPIPSAVRLSAPKLCLIQICAARIRHVWLSTQVQCVAVRAHRRPSPLRSAAAGGDLSRGTSPF